MAEKRTKKKNNKKKNEYVVDYNPDDFQVGEEIGGLKRNDLKQVEKDRDLNPDDFEDFNTKR